MEYNYLLKQCQITKEDIKRYENFTLYQVYGTKGNEKVPLYKTCGS